jgi:hypothetical protein
MMFKIWHIWVRVRRTTYLWLCRFYLNPAISALTFHPPTPTPHCPPLSPQLYCKGILNTNLHIDPPHWEYPVCNIVVVVVGVQFVKNVVAHLRARVVMHLVTIVAHCLSVVVVQLQVQHFELVWYLELI